LVNLFREHGAASNQIGKTYEYRAALRGDTRALLDAIKRDVDPNGLMNPGALGFDR
jgi:FAD/FMN-containing dehydrogenase